MIPLPIQSGTTARAREYVDVMALDALPVGTLHPLRLGMQRVLLLRADSDEVHAIADRCPHALQPLADGYFESGTLRCAKHGACFDVATGRPLNPVTDKPLTRFPLRVRDGRIEILPDHPE